MRIETDRLIIRPPVKEDLESSFEIWGNHEVRKFSGGAATREQFEVGFFEGLKNQKSNYGFRSVFDKEHQLHIGDCGLIKKEIESKEEIELVYFFNHLYWGKGLATEAAIGLREYVGIMIKSPAKNETR